jgi:hypothetical protein
MIASGLLMRDSYPPDCPSAMGIFIGRGHTAPMRISFSQIPDAGVEGD